MHTRQDTRLGRQLMTTEIPLRFCWTKFGTESGEVIEEILARKDSERLKNDGIFLWGIGTSVAPGIRELVRLERKPMAIFSPMRSKPKSIDSEPESVVVWRKARKLDGVEWRIPSGSTVISRAGSGRGTRKRLHYALVCRSEVPLQIGVSQTEVRFSALSNLLSGSPLGFSQVSSVVTHDPRIVDAGGGPVYAIGFLAHLVYPYFIELFDPTPLSNISADRRREQECTDMSQADLAF